jgi:hypothetical protein
LPVVEGADVVASARLVAISGRTPNFIVTGCSSAGSGESAPDVLPGQLGGVVIDGQHDFAGDFTEVDLLFIFV